jgi:putative membrane protein
VERAAPATFPKEIEMKAIILTTSLSMLLAFSAFGQKMTDQQFVDNAGQINMTEAHLGKLAQQKAGENDFKEYGQQLEKDHTDAYQKLTSIANGFTVPKSIDAEHLKTVNRFEKLSGQSFDKQFKQTMIQDHQKAIDMFKRAQDELTNQQLKTYATEQLPILQTHLDMAKNLGTKTTSKR